MWSGVRWSSTSYHSCPVALRTGTGVRRVRPENRRLAKGIRATWTKTADGEEQGLGYGVSRRSPVPDQKRDLSQHILLGVLGPYGVVTLLTCGVWARPGSLRGSDSAHMRCMDPSWVLREGDSTHIRCVDPVFRVTGPLVL